MDEFDLAEFQFPIFSGVEAPDIYRVDAFLGSGFWISSDGKFLTCKHIFEKLKPNQKPAIAQPFSANGDRFIPIVSWKMDPDVDIALGTIHESSIKRKFLSPYQGKIGLGLDVQALGFMEWEKIGKTITMSPRLLRGHIARIFPESVNGLPCRSLLEISFPSPNGFSGGPLLVDQQVVGMLYGNIESRLQAYAIDELIDGTKQYKETSYRVHEFGLAHQLDDILWFLNKCEVTGFR